MAGCTHERLCVVILVVLSAAFVLISDGVLVKHVIKPILAESDVTVTLPCDFTTATYETPQITWYQEHAGGRRQIMQYDIHNRLSSYGEFVDRVARGDRGALVLLRPKTRDTGNYTCEVEVDNETPSWVKTTVQLLVAEEPLTTVTFTAGITELSQKESKDVKAGMVFFIAFLWMIPMVCSFLLGQKGFNLCKETPRNLRTKTPRELFALVSVPVLVSIAFCLVLASSVCTGIALSSTLLEAADYYRAVGLTSGILGTILFLLIVLQLYLGPNIQCRKKAPDVDSVIHDVSESGNNGENKSAEDNSQDAGVSFYSSGRRPLEKDTKTLPEETEPFLTQGSIETEKLESKLVEVPNPSNDAVKSIVFMSQNQVYLTTLASVYRTVVDKGMIQKENAKLWDFREDIIMIEKYESDLIMLTRDVRSKKYKTHLFLARLAEVKHKYSKIDLDSKSTPTWAVTGWDAKTLYLTMSSPASVFKKTNDKKQWREFGEAVLKNPACIIQNSSGQLIVADSRKNDLLVFEDNGEFVTSMGISVPRKLESDMNGCNRLAIDPGDNIYVTGPKSKNILVFSPDFRFKRALPTRAERGGDITYVTVQKDWLYVAHEDCIRVHSLK